MGQYNDPKTGRFIANNQASKVSERSAARRIYETLRAIATPELIEKTINELLAEGGHVKRATFEMLLHYTAGKPKERLEITGADGQSLFSIETLSPEDQLALESITLKALAPSLETVKIIDAEFETIKSEDSSDLREV